MKKLVVMYLVLAFCGCSAVFNGPNCNIGDELAAEKVDNIKKIKLVGVVHFENASYALSKQDKEMLDNIATRINAENAKTAIYGHASHYTITKDPIQRILINLEISNYRAVQVVNYLMSKGVKAENIQGFAMYDSRPVANEKTLSGQAANRRAEIYLYWPE